MISPDIKFKSLPILAYLIENELNSVNLWNTKLTNNILALDENIVEKFDPWCLNIILIKLNKIYPIPYWYALFMSFYETEVIIKLIITEIPFFAIVSRQYDKQLTKLKNFNSPKNTSFTRS